MKYKDNNFSKFQDRQIDGIESSFTSKSDRQVRREQNIDFLFSIQSIFLKK